MGSPLSLYLMYYITLFQYSCPSLETRNHSTFHQIRSNITSSWKYVSKTLSNLASISSSFTHLIRIIYQSTLPLQLYNTPYFALTHNLIFLIYPHSLVILHRIIHNFPPLWQIHFLIISYSIIYLNHKLGSLMDPNFLILQVSLLYLEIKYFIHWQITHFRFIIFCWMLCNNQCSSVVILI